MTRGEMQIRNIKNKINKKIVLLFAQRMEIISQCPQNIQTRVGLNLSKQKRLKQKTGTLRTLMNNTFQQTLADVQSATGHVVLACA